jgi:peptide/nickel transport system substrate-binding protein
MARPMTPAASKAALYFALPVALTLSACGGSSTGNSGGSSHTGSKNIVHIAIADDPSSLDPQAVEDGNALAVYDNISEPLVFRTADTNQLEPGLALSWQQQGNDAWRVKLRPNVKFSDGEPFNADAVVYSIGRITNKSYASEQSDWVGNINGAKKVDDMTVDITTSQPDPAVPERLSLIMMVPPQASKNKDFATHPVGTGPYTMVSWTKGAKAVIKANPNYWGDAPKIAQADFQPIKEPTVRLSSLQTGEVNLVSDLLPEQMKLVPQAVQTAGLEFPTVILDTRGGPFKDPRVRQAANYAVDSKTLLDKLYNGLGSLANCQVFGQAVFGYNPDLKPFGYDPNKAKQLLQQAGDPHPSVTFVGDSSGRWLKDVELEQGIAGYLRDVGFNVKLQLDDFPTYLKELFPSKNDASVARPDMIFVSTDNVLGDADVQFHTYFASDGGGASTSNPQVDQLVTAGRSELDKTKRLQTYQQVDKIACDGAYFINMMNLDNVYGLTKDLSWTPRYDASILVKTMSWK